MNQVTSSSKKTKPAKVRASGEPFVWFTGMGLSLGLLMVLGLLWVIISNGIVVFWPQKVGLYELSANSEARLNDSNVLAGELRQVQKKSVQGGGEEEIERQEIQLYIGNRDAYGLSFRFIDQQDILGVEYEKELLILERLEYGDAIGYPVRLVTGAGETLEYQPEQSEAFYAQLRELVDAANDRRSQINEIEKSKIGRINARMERARIALKEEGISEEEAATVNARLSELQNEYEVLAAEARSLRDQQEVDKLFYRLSTAQEREIRVGHLLDFYNPNQLGIVQRITRFLHNVWLFLSEDPREANTEGGVFPAIFGTFIMTLMMSVAVVPFGVIAAIYLREYAKQGPFVRAVRIAVNNLAGVPAIVFGVFGLGFFVYFVGGTLDQLLFSDRLPTPTYGTGGILWASLTLALMTVPVVIVATEEALAAVPRGMKEGSLACGASKWQTIQRIVLPAAVPGMITGLILAMARGAGEVAPLMLVGVVKLAPTLPLDTIFPFFHFDRKFMHLGFHIYDLGFQSPDSEAAKPMVFATTFLLIVLVVMLNIVAIILRERLRKKYATGAF